MEQLAPVNTHSCAECVDAYNCSEVLRELRYNAKVWAHKERATRICVAGTAIVVCIVVSKLAVRDFE